MSRLTDNPLGRLIANQAREAGVSTEHVVWTTEDRVGLYFLEFGAAPRASSVLYDRKGAAVAGIQPGMVPWADVFRGVKWFHVTGITPALSRPPPRRRAKRCRPRKAAASTTSIDLNYRVKLWRQAEAEPLHDRPDVLLRRTGHDGGGRRESPRRHGQGPRGRGRAADARFPLRAVAVTIRDNPLVWKNAGRPSPARRAASSRRGLTRSKSWIVSAPATRSRPV